MSSSYTIRVVVFQDGAWWVGQCLEYDIAAQARTLPALYIEVERLLVGRLVVAHERGVLPFAGLPVAPPRFWQMFDRAPLGLQRTEWPLLVPPDVRERIPWPEVRIAEPALA